MGTTSRKKQRKIDLLVIFLVGAMMLAIGSSWMLHEAGGKVVEVYDDPLAHEGGSAIHHTPVTPHAVKAPATRD